MSISTNEHSQPTITAKDAAFVLGMSEAWVRKAVLRRRLPFLKIGRAIRFRQSDLDRWILAHSVPALEREKVG
jgi:excisionase family DNA binding protein